MAKSKVTNISGQCLTLPMPWSRILGPGRAVIIESDADTLTTFFGGGEAIRGLLDVAPCADWSTTDLAGIPAVTPRIWFSGGVVMASADDATVTAGRLKVGVRAELAALRVGEGNQPGYYTPGQEASLDADGVNPATVEVIRWQDIVTGDYYLLSMQGGVLTIIPA